jgi:phosphoribosyl 1,2-cyclic phosphodiesterase
MIKITAYASSSKGNLYTLDNGQSRLILDCGLPWKQMQKALDFRTDDVAGVLVTHEHMDHAKAVKDAARAGLDIYLSKGTADAIGATGHRIHHVKSLQQFPVAEWTIMPFDTVHDSAEPLGFLIATGKEKILFMTDSAYCRYRFTGITQLMLECNFSNEIMERNIELGIMDQCRKKRLLESHFSLGRVIDFLKVNDISKLKEIYLLHLSDGNSDEHQFKTEIQRLTGVPVHICKEHI